MDPQLTTQEPIRNLLDGAGGYWWACFGKLGFTYDAVLDEELSLEIVANLFGGHGSIDETRLSIFPRTRGFGRSEARMQ